MLKINGCSLVKKLAMTHKVTEIENKFIDQKPDKYVKKAKKKKVKKKCKININWWEKVKKTHKKSKKYSEI